MTLMDKKILDQLFVEMGKPVDEMDIDLIDKLVNEGLSEPPKKTPKQKIKSMARKIISEHESKQAHGYHHASRRLVIVYAVVALTLISAIAVSANKGYLEDGLRWVKEKFNINTTANFSDASTEVVQQIENIFNSEDFYLPADIPNNYSPNSFLSNQRTSECRDINIGFVSNGDYLNFVISVYENSDMANVELPFDNTDVEERIYVGGIEIFVLSIDETFTACYRHQNKIYQISSNMNYDSFVVMLQSITNNAGSH